MHHAHAHTQRCNASEHRGRRACTCTQARSLCTSLLGVRPVRESPVCCSVAVPPARCSPLVSARCTCHSSPRLTSPHLASPVLSSPLLVLEEQTDHRRGASLQAASAAASASNKTNAP